MDPKIVELLNDEGSIFFERELEAIKAKTFDVQYADLMYRSIFPIATDTNPGATHITYQVYDKRGIAKIINNYAGDLPRADVDGREVTIPVRTVAASFGYSRKEILSARMAGKPLSQMRADAARRAIEEFMNDVSLFGDSDSGLFGVLTHPNIPTSDVPNGAATTPEWSTKTADEILDDINAIFSEINDNTKGKERANTLLLPLAQWNLIFTKRVPDLSMTIAQLVIQNSPYLSSPNDIIAVPQLEGAGTAGVDVMVAYPRDPMKVEFEIPEDIVFHPEERRNLEVITPVTAECGGLNVYYPLAFNIKEKI